jgi:two-component system sensor histidine kinase KdpD
MLCFNFFFLPPVGTFTISDPQNWVALFAFVAVSLVASNLSAAVRTREHEAVARRDELARLFDLSRDVLLITESRDAVAVLVRAIGRRFDLEYVAIALPRATEWDIFAAGLEAIVLDPQQLWSAFTAAQRSIQFDAYARTYSGHGKMILGAREVSLVPLRSGTRPIGLLAATGRPVEAGSLDALAGIAAIAIERAQFLEERKAAELTRQSEQLKATLLASVGHDLRTPLTAIRLAATNIRDGALPPEQRDEQSDLILSEAERLTRLFQNILEMARIDAGAVTMQTRWTHPSEILAGARAQVEETLRSHPLNLALGDDLPVRIDPRVAATALAHVLENAAQYGPAASPIDVSALVTDDELTLQVRDHGPGIGPAELPHLFERFYRGEAAKSRTSGTGMGLWIARGFLGVLGGRIWAENCADGGARFTMVIPAPSRPPLEIDEAHA